MQIRKFARKAFFVEAVQVTDDNMAEVAAWCGGEILVEPSETSVPRPYIKVNVHRPLNKKQSQAFPTDWVLRSNTGWKVYTDQAIENSFEIVEEESTGANVFEQNDPEVTIDRITHRDAVTGEFVNEAYAEDNPTTTVAERNDPREARKI